MKIKSSIAGLALFSVLAASAQTVSLVATAPVGGTGISSTLTVQTNQVLKFLHAYIPPEADPAGEPVRNPFIVVTIGTNAFSYLNKLDMVVPGPASVQLKVLNTNTFYATPCSVYATFQISDNLPQFTPSSAVVIPADAVGPVNIILESSPDLLNWTGALPGTYGSSATNRFFRLRAVRQ